MRIQQHHFSNHKWEAINQQNCDGTFNCCLVLVFGCIDLINSADIYEHLKALYPVADIVFASTSGEIAHDTVYDKSIIATAIEFTDSTIKCASLALTDYRDSYTTGAELMDTLSGDNLAYVFLISDGTKINGSELVAGFNSRNPQNIPVSGGLAGDGDRFQKTYTGLNMVPSEGNVIAVGFYGEHIRIGHGSVGGWDEFGHERTITRSDKNILYEIDNRNALSLYKDYLGDYIKELPGSALLFPLSLKKEGASTAVVRTILAINETDSSMTFAGNMPEGSRVRLMKANFDRLIEGASNAASFSSLKEHKPQLAILISCVGRKLILQHRVEEEVEAAREIFGSDVVLTGFYSYGEISPFSANAKCELHNQTMTITTFTEL